jgi:RNA polymerase sigma-70 factor, ECF subfamily
MERCIKMDSTLITNEDSLIENILKGDRKEFALFVDQHSAMIYNLALRMLQNPQDAEDVLQETFLKAHRHLSTFKGQSSLRTWLYRIAMNEALMVLRKRKPEANILEMDEPQDEDEQEPIQIVDWCCLPETELLTEESKNFMEMAISKLSPALKSVFILRDIDGLSVRDTAQTLKISEEAVKTRLFRARFELRQQLSGYFGKHLK